MTTLGGGGVLKSPDQPLYDPGNTVTLTATPNAGYCFAGWSGDLTGTSNPATLTIDANKSVTAMFVTSDDFNDGKINDQLWDAVIDGFGPQVDEVNHRLEMRLPATSHDGGDAIFRAAYRTKPYVEGNFDIQVDYQLLSWPEANGVRVGLVASGSGFGTVERTSLGSASDAPGTPREVVGVNVMSQITHTPNTSLSGRLRMSRVGSTWTGYYLDGRNWTQIASYNGSTDGVQVAIAAWSHDYAFTDHDVLVAFDNFQITVGDSCGVPTAFALDVTTVGSGTVAKTPDLLVYGGDTPVVLTAVPAPGWSFVGWSDDTTTSTNPITLAMTRDRRLAATFAVNTYTIAASAGANGSIIPSGLVALSAGDTAKFVIVAVACYAIADVLVDGVSVGPVSSYTLANVQVNHTIEATFTPSTPWIISIADVHNDQGREARINFVASSRDAAGSPTPIIQYETYRRIDPLPSPARVVRPLQAAGVRERVRLAHETGMISDPGVLLAGWEFSGAIPAHGEAEYNVIVPTLVDSNAANGLRYSAFFVRAATSVPTTFFDSCVDSGYSVDNLPPAIPSQLEGSIASGSVALHWAPNSEPDFVAYRIYRENSADFVPGAANLIATRADTGYVDAGTAVSFYKVSAMDWNGNESGFAPLAPLGTLDGPGGRTPSALWLGAATPNPAPGGAVIPFGLPRGEHVSLVVHDAAGRIVRDLANGVFGPGEHVARWDGRDAAGHMVPSAIYFCRLRVGSKTLTGRIAVVH